MSICINILYNIVLRCFSMSRDMYHVMCNTCLLNEKTPLTFTLSEPKVISQFVTSIESGQPTLPCSLTGFILLADQLSVLILISPEIIIDSSKNTRWITSFEKIGMVRVKRGIFHILFRHKTVTKYQYLLGQAYQNNCKTVNIIFY